MPPTSTVCQGLQSCLEPLLFEPRVLMHQLVPSKQSLSFPWPHKQPEPQNSKNRSIDKIFESNRNDEESHNCWNFMQVVTNPSCNSIKSIDETDKVYVHPLSKRSTSFLSAKSLEMCTESLGSETGSANDSGIDEFTHHVLEKQSSPKTRELIKKVRHSNSFPPPLTSIGGSEGVQVQTHREGGRLVIKAFNFSSSSSYFQAERENGRLRLSLLKGGYRERELDESKEESDQENVDEAEKECDEGSDDGDDLGGSFWGESIKDDGGKVGCNISGGDEWSSTTSRCNGDTRKRLPSLPFWVAIS